MHSFYIFCMLYKHPICSLLYNIVIIHVSFIRFILHLFPPRDNNELILYLQISKLSYVYNGTILWLPHSSTIAFVHEITLGFLQFSSISFSIIIIQNQHTNSLPTVHNIYFRSTQYSYYSISCFSATQRHRINSDFSPNSSSFVENTRRSFISLFCVEINQLIAFM